jgi:succinyl-diaminopimelate desuccinylase
VSTPDPLPLAQRLLRCASVTPADAGAQDVLAEALAELGFSVTRLPFGGISNLYARIGERRPHLCFAGHTDVVPPGAGWSHDPFAGEVAEGRLVGRGACDMKGAIAAWVAACAGHLQAGPPRGSLSLLITGDEEGVATDGTARMVDWLAERPDQIPDFCLVGEPTNPHSLGDVIKIGRRGSLTARLTVHGTQGHVAYPHLADNPVHRLLHALAELTAARLDAGTDWFEPSSVQVVSIDVGNPAVNVIPAEARATLNIRFNDRHTGAALAEHIRAVLARHAERAAADIQISGEAFLTEPGALVARLQAAVAGATGRTPRLETGGGTSDARFIARICPVAEFGLVGATMHKTDESVPVAEMRALAKAYRAVIDAFLRA